MRRVATLGIRDNFVMFMGTLENFCRASRLRACILAEVVVVISELRGSRSRVTLGASLGLKGHDHVPHGTGGPT